MNIATFDSNFDINYENSEPTQSSAIFWWTIAAVVLHIGVLVLMEYFKTLEPKTNRQRSFDVVLSVEHDKAVAVKDIERQEESGQLQQQTPQTRQVEKIEKTEPSTSTELESITEQKPESKVQPERAKQLQNTMPKPFVIPSYQQSENQRFTDPLNPNPTKGTLSQSVMLNTDAMAIAKLYIEMLDENQQLKAEAFDKDNMFQSKDNLGNFEFSSQKFADGSLGVQVKNFGKKTCFRVEQSLSMDAFQDQQRWYIVPCG